MPYPLYPSSLGYRDIQTDFKCLGIPLDLQEDDAIVALCQDDPHIMFISSAAYRVFGTRSREEIEKILISIRAQEFAQPQLPQKGVLQRFYLDKIVLMRQGIRHEQVFLSVQTRLEPALWVFVALNDMPNLVSNDAPIVPLSAAEEAQINLSSQSIMPSTDDASMGFTWVADARRRFLRLSSPFCDVIGADLASFLGQDFVQLVGAFSQEGAASLKAAFESRQMWHGVEIAWPLQGIQEFMPVSFSAFPSFTSEGYLTGFHGFGSINMRQFFELKERVRNRIMQMASKVEEVPVLKKDNVVHLSHYQQKSVPLEKTESSALVQEDKSLTCAQFVEPALDILSDEEHLAFTEIGWTLEKAQHAAVDIEQDILDECELEHDPDIYEILDLLPQGAVVLGEQGEILWLNKAAQVLFGYTSQECITKPFSCLFMPESHLRLRKAVSLLHPEQVSYSLFACPKQGEAFELNAVFKKADIHRSHCLCTLTDMRPIRQVEGALHTAQQALKDMNSVKTNLLARVGHEIRTPLNAILGFSEMMLEDQGRDISNLRYKSYLKDIHMSGEHVLSLVNDLLDLSRVEAGKLQLSPIWIDLNRLVRECVSLLQPQANNAQVVVRMALSHHIPALWFDERAMRQILLNLLSNAIKFNAAGGQVIVSTGMSEQGRVYLHLRDTGRGLSDADLDVVFEPFSQIAAASLEVGTGLGLALTKALVEANNAQLLMRSKKDEGTFVEVCFELSA